MSDRPGPNHVAVHVEETACQVLIGLYGGGVVSVFPEGTFSALALVVGLRRSARNQLHIFRDDVVARIQHQQVDVIGGNDVVEYAQAVALLRFGFKGSRV